MVESNSFALGNLVRLQNGLLLLPGASASMRILLGLTPYQVREARSVSLAISSIGFQILYFNTSVSLTEWEVLQVIGDNDAIHGISHLIAYTSVTAPNVVGNYTTREAVHLFGGVMFAGAITIPTFTTQLVVMDQRIEVTSIQWRGDKTSCMGYSHGAAVYFAGAVYFFGGAKVSNSDTFALRLEDFGDHICEFTFATRAVSLLQQHMPKPLFGSSAFLGMWVWMAQSSLLQR